MNESKYIIVSTLVVLAIIAGGYFYWNKIQNSQLVPKGPKIIEAWLNPPIPAWDQSASDYRTTLNVRYEPMTSPLLLTLKIHFKNQNGEGTYQDTVDISQWARGGSVYRIRTFKKPGDYTLTVVLRNSEGETSLDLPTITVK